MIEKELLWEELGLDSLLTYEQSLEKKLDSKLLKNKPEAVVIKHHKMLKKPTYAVVMNRYKSEPHKPKIITKSKLSELADPILGKLTHNERLKVEKYNGIILPPRSSPNQTDDERDGDEVTDHRSNYLNNSPLRHPNPFHQINDIKVIHNKIVVSQELQEELFLSPIKEESSEFTGRDRGEGLFLTEMEESGNYNRMINAAKNQNIIENNIKNNKNSFASLLRDRVQVAQKVSKLLQPIDLEEMNEQSPVKSHLLPAKQAAVPSSSSAAANSIYNKAMNPINANQRQRKANLKQQIVQQHSKKSLGGAVGGGGANKFMRGVKDDESIRSNKKIKSSGYSSQVKRYSNQPKPLPMKKKKEPEIPEKELKRQLSYQNYRKRMESNNNTFLTAAGGDTTDDENSQKNANNRRSTSITRKRVNIPVRQSNQKSVASQKSNNLKNNPRNNRHANMKDNNDNNNNKNNRRAPSIERNQSKTNLEDKNARYANRRSLPALNRNSKNMKSADSLTDSSMNTNNKPGRSYGIKRSSASVPALLRQKVEASRPVPTGGGGGDHSIHINSDVQITELEQIQQLQQQIQQKDQNVVQQLDTLVMESPKRKQQQQNHLGSPRALERQFSDLSTNSEANSKHQQQNQDIMVDNGDIVLSEDRENLTDLISKLSSFEKQGKINNKPTIRSQKIPETKIQDQQMTSLLKKHAEKLNSYISNAEKNLSNYSHLKELA
jgi:hypothetical protein